MIISSFQTQVVDLGSAPGAVRGTPGENLAAFVTLTLRTKDGVEGLGYAGFAPRMMLPALEAAVDALAALTVGMDAGEIEKIQARLLFEPSFGSPAGLVTRAASAIDVALWDLRGKALGQPVWKLLGGYRDRVPVYASGSLWRNASLDELARTGQELVERGFRAMKLRLGGEASVEAEVERARVLREAVGPDVTLMVDINQGWDVNRAIRVGRELERLGFYWLEDPVDFEDLAGMKTIADALDLPVCAGEYSYGIRSLGRLLSHGSVDILMIDLLRAGGLTGWMKAAHMAEAFSRPVVTHLATEVLMHAAGAAPNTVYVEHMPWAFPLFRQEEPVIENGEIVLPHAPGLSLEFDPAALERYAA